MSCFLGAGTGGRTFVPATFQHLCMHTVQQLDLKIRCQNYTSVSAVYVQPHYNVCTTRVHTCMVAGVYVCVHAYSLNNRYVYGLL